MNDARYPSHNTGELLTAFESAWQSGGVDCITGFIPADARNDTDLIAELACIDLEHRLKQDQETSVEHYTTLFPKLAEDDLVLLELIRTEVAFRSDRATLAVRDYVKRFPDLRAHIEMMFELEFNQSSLAHLPESTADWRCASCDTLVAGRMAGDTRCPDCGQPIVIGRYELLERVGEGAFGFVYRARDPKLDRDVAVKLPRSHQFLMPEESERFLRESRNAAQLDHPGIVKVFDTGKHDDLPYIVSEFVDGQPLSDVLKEEPDLGFRQAARTVLQVAVAVAHAHERGVIHRDLKPANIMTNQDTDGDLVLQVMDFGLARRDQSDTTVTMEGQAVGTPAYMSPEQARGDLTNVGVQSDVYSMGVLLFELLCGEVPFRGNVQMLIQQVINDDPPSPARFRNRIPRDLETICMKAIAREPSDRYDSAESFADDLERWLKDEPIKARRIGYVGRTTRWCRRRPAVATLLAGLALSVVVGVSGITWQWQQAETARNRSEADLRDALESVDRVLGHLGSDTLADIPQAKQLRVNVLNDALEFFERFRNRNPEDPRIAMQVADAHYQVARIQNALGRREEAREAFEAATKGYDELKKSAPDRTKWLSAASAAHAGFAGFLRAERSELALTHQETTVALRKLLHEENPKSGKHAAKYASARADLARTLRVHGTICAEYNAAIEQLRVLEQTRDAIGYKRDLARVLNNYAIYVARKGQHGSAERYREEAIALYEQVIAKDPNSESKRAMYASCCLQLVESLRQESRLKAAVEYQQKAVRTYQSLTEDFPATPRHRERFAAVLEEVASLAKVQKRLEDAAAANTDAIRQWETLVAMFPSKISYQQKLSRSLGRLSDALVATNRKPDAEDRMRQRVKLCQALAAEGKAIYRIEQSIALRQLASLIATSRSAKKKAEAEQLRKNAGECIADIAVEDVMNGSMSRSQKSTIVSALISHAQQRGDEKELETCYRAKLEIYKQRTEEYSENLAYRKSLAKYWGLLGECLKKQAKTADSIEAYRQAIEVDEQLLELNPNSATYVTQLIGHTSSMANHLMFSGRPDEAAEVIRRSLDLAQQLAEERSNEGFRQTRVVLAYLQLASALGLAGDDHEAAKQAYEQALALSDALPKQPGLEQFEAHVRNSFAWFLVACPDESQRDPERSLGLARLCVAADPTHASYVSTLAFALYETGEFEEAIEAFEKSSQLSQKLAPLNLLLTSMAHAKLGEMQPAKARYSEAIQRNTEGSAEPELFEIYRKQADKLLAPSEEEPSTTKEPPA